MTTIAPYAKAITGFIAPGIGILIFALTDASKGGDAIVQSEWLLALFTCLGTGGAVWAVPNRDPRAAHQNESVQPPNAGA